MPPTPSADPLLRQIRAFAEGPNLPGPALVWWKLLHEGALQAAPSPRADLAQSLRTIPKVPSYPHVLGWLGLLCAPIASRDLDLDVMHEEEIRLVVATRRLALGGSATRRGLVACLPVVRALYVDTLPMTTEDVVAMNDGVWLGALRKLTQEAGS